MLHVGVCCAVVSVPYSLVATCWERAVLLAVVSCHFPKCVLVHIRIKDKVGLSPPVKYFYWPFQVGASFCGSFVLLMSSVFQAYAPVHCCLVFTCKNADIVCSCL